MVTARTVVEGRVESPWESGKKFANATTCWMKRKCSGLLHTLMAKLRLNYYQDFFSSIDSHVGYEIGWIKFRLMKDGRRGVGRS